MSLDDTIVQQIINENGYGIKERNEFIEHLAKGYVENNKPYDTITGILQLANIFYSAYYSNSYSCSRQFTAVLARSSKVHYGEDFEADIIPDLIYYYCRKDFRLKLENKNVKMKDGIGKIHLIKPSLGIHNYQLKVYEFNGNLIDTKDVYFRVVP